MERLHKAAEWYLDKGWSVTPVNVTSALEGKKIKKVLRFPPEWKSYQVTKMPLEEVAQRWQGFNSIAVITGKLSGITVIDIDRNDLPEMADLPPTYRVKTRKGYQYYFLYNPTIDQSQNRVPDIDIRNDGGLVLAPPSTYRLPDGSVFEYQLIEPADLEPFPVEWYTKVSKKHGIDSAKHKFELDKIVSSGSRNNTATSVCGKLLLRFKEDEWLSQAWPLLKAWNQTHNTPALDEEELLAVFKSISQAEANRRITGAVVGEPQLVENDEKFVISVPITDGFAVFEFEDVEYSSRSIDAIVRCSVDIPGTPSKRLVQRINILSSSAKDLFSRQLKDSFVSSQKIPWPLVFSQACELLEASFKKQSQEEEWNPQESVSTDYLIKPFIEEGASNIIFGKGGSGKTYLALSMAISLATGGSFLGSDPPKVANTLFIDYENTKSIWASRITKLLRGSGVEDTTSINQRMFYFSTKGVPIHDLKSQLIEAIRKRSIGLIIVDSAALACGGEPESAEVANRLFNALNRLKTTVLMIAHETKSTDNKNKSPFGSVFFYNCARNIWNVESSQDNNESKITVGLFHRKSNNDRLSSMKQATIEFTDDSVSVNLGFSNLWSKELSLHDQILDELSEGDMTLEELVKVLGKSKGQIKARLSEMRSEQKLTNPERGKWALKRGENQNTQMLLT